VSSRGGSAEHCDACEGPCTNVEEHGTIGSSGNVVERLRRQVRREARQETTALRSDRPAEESDTEGPEDGP
jgi:hypothetical protein